MNDSKNVVIVTILGLGTDAQEVTVQQGDTVAVALAKTVLDTEGMDIRMDSKPVADVKTETIKEDAIITAMPAVEGGC